MTEQMGPQPTNQTFPFIFRIGRIFPIQAVLDFRTFDFRTTRTLVH